MIETYHFYIRCECYGNARNARYILGNETNNGTCICECEPSTFTEGKKVCGYE